MIAQGKFGAVNGFHRRKVKRWQEIAAEHAQENADKMIRKLDAMIEQPKDKRLQLEAIRQYAQMEDWAVKNEREDAKEFRSMTNQQLDSRLLELMGEALGLDLSEITDGEVVEDETISLADAAKILAGSEDDYDPMERELGGDRLAAGAEMILAADGCQRCAEERLEIERLIREQGIDDEGRVAEVVENTRCVRHRFQGAVAQIEAA